MLGQYSDTFDPGCIRKYDQISYTFDNALSGDTFAVNMRMPVFRATGEVKRNNDFRGFEKYMVARTHDAEYRVYYNVDKDIRPPVMIDKEADYERELTDGYHVYELNLSPYYSITEMEDQ